MKKLAVAASALGIFSGLGGASHGPGEMLQGHVAPNGIYIEAWPFRCRPELLLCGSPNGIYIEAWPSITTLAGEPAMTIIPSYLITGVLTVLVGVLLAVWAGKFAMHKNGGLILIALSIVMLLVGGGLIPPFFGVAGGLIAVFLNYQNAMNGGADA